MGISANTVSLTRYHIHGSIAKPIMDTVYQALVDHTINR